MRKVAYVVFFLLIIMAVIVMTVGNPVSLFSPSSQTKHEKVDVGFVMLNQTDIYQKVNFDDVIINAPYTGLDWENSTEAAGAKDTAATTHIHLIRGYDLDAAGNATSWIFVIQQPDRVSLVAYDRYGEKISSWLGKYPETEINISQIISPRVLFEKNRDRIFPTPDAITTESRELALAGDTYYLTITNQGKTRELIFDAKTGALTSSND